jgi:hypothetical protein
MISSDYEKIWKDTYGVDFVAKTEKGEKVIGVELTKSITKIRPFIVKEANIPVSVPSFRALLNKCLLGKVVATLHNDPSPAQ